MQTKQNNSKETLYTALSVEKKGTEVTIRAEIPVAQVTHLYEKALHAIAREVEIQGFRKGHAPTEMVLAQVGEMAVLEETAERAIELAYPAIVKDEALSVVGRPAITVTKIAKDNPIGFTAVVALFPEFTLPDYKTLANEEYKKHPDPEAETVSEEEVQAELERLRVMLAREGGAHVHGADCDHDHEQKEEEGKEVQEEKNLPPLDDAFAQSLGGFQTLAELNDVIKKGLLGDKKRKAFEKRRIAIVDRVLEKTPITLPEVIVAGELETMHAEFESKVERAGMKLADYQARIGKTDEDMKKEWRSDAEKRAKLQLVINAIAEREQMTPEKEKFDREVAHIKEHYPDADLENIRTYVATNMINEKVFEFLEGK